MHTRFSTTSMRAHELDLFGRGMLGWYPITDVFGTRFLWVRLTAHGGDATYVKPRPDVELNLRSEVLTGSGKGSSLTGELHASLLDFQGKGPVNDLSTLTGSLVPLTFASSRGHGDSTAEADKDIYRYNTKGNGAIEFSRNVAFSVANSSRDIRVNAVNAPAGTLSELLHDLARPHGILDR